MLHFKNNIEILLFIIELFGCVSFATSGAIKAIRKNADYLGVLILTLIETFGGGLLRDLIINQYPPKIFWHNEYLVLALFSFIVATFWFLVGYFNKTASIIDSHRHDLWIYLLDAFGIAVFCIYGVQAANASLNEVPLKDASELGNYIYIISLGVITGVGGGMFRDVFVGEIPMVFRKHFYITPCIIGTTVYAILFKLNVGSLLSIFVGTSIIVLLRTFAVIFKWNLPTAKGYINLKKNVEKSTNL